jgi:hypothetical protein
MLLLLTQIEPALAVLSEIIRTVSREREIPNLIAGISTQVSMQILH